MKFFFKYILRVDFDDQFPFSSYTEVKCLETKETTVTTFCSVNIIYSLQLNIESQFDGDQHGRILF